MNIFGGLICILIGIASIGYTYKFPTKNSALLPNLSGYLGGIIFIIVGILLIIGYFK